MGEASAGQLDEFTIDSIANRFADLYESLFENLKQRSGRWAM
jgi:hypothetical protein